MSVRLGGYIPLWPASLCAAGWLICHGVLELIQWVDAQDCRWANDTDF